MKTKCTFLFLLLLLFLANAGAQNIRNDTIALSTNAVVELIFPSAPGGDVTKGDGSYRASGGKKNSLLLQALKKDAPNQQLIVTEKDNKRKHRFVLTYKDEIDIKVIDWSSLKKLREHTKDKQDAARKQTEIANQLYDQGALKEALAKYKWLVNEVGEENEAFIGSRVTEIEKRITEDREKIYGDAMAKGNGFAGQNSFKEADGEFKKALSQKPGDTAATNRMNGNGRNWFADCIARAKQAHRQEKYILEKNAYEEARDVNDKDFERYKSEYAKAATFANNQLHDQQEAKGDAAYKRNDWPAAKIAYDSALLAVPTDARCKERLKNVMTEIARRKETQENEMAYYRSLYRAKKFTETNEKAKAIAEYEEALKRCKDRKFPAERIAALRGR